MSELLEPHIGLWGLTKCRQAPLGVWCPRGRLNSACRESEHFLAPEAGQKWQVKTKWVMWLVPETREVSGPAWAKQTLQHQSECCQDQGRLHGSSIRDNLDFWWWSDCNGLCQDPCAIPPPAPLAPALLPSGARSCWVQEEHTPKVNWISPPRASAPAVWNLTLSLTGWLQWPNRREALPYTWFYSKPVSASLLLFHSTHLLHFFFLDGSDI